jgi:hypothetical protein
MRKCSRIATILAVLAAVALLCGAVAGYAGSTGEDSSNTLVSPDDFTGQRVPLGFLITNWDCGPCVQANQALDAYIPPQGNDVALIRVHCWWPGDDDPIYFANEDQAEFLVWNTPTGADFAPHLWLDNYVNAGSNGAGYANYYENQKLVPAPLEIAVPGYRRPCHHHRDRCPGTLDRYPAPLPLGVRRVPGDGLRPGV